MANKGTSKPSRARAPPPKELKAHIDKALALRGKADTGRVYRMMQFMFDPQVLHIDRIDKSRPSLYVSNHASWGWEGGFLPSIIRAHTGRLPRLLTDSQLMLSRFSDSLMDLGMVLANPKVCAAMMEAGESILVFPGGAREGAKRRGEQYKLFWEGRTGFVRMAVEHGFNITPVANIGPDEMWDIRWDAEDMAGTWVESLMRRFIEDDFDTDLIPPFPRGLLGTIVPRPERLYVAFGDPVDTSPYAGRQDDAALLNRIKRKVQVQLEELIKEALLFRARRRHDMHWFRRLLTRY